MSSRVWRRYSCSALCFLRISCWYASTVSWVREMSWRSWAFSSSASRRVCPSSCCNLWDSTELKLAAATCCSSRETFVSILATRAIRSLWTDSIDFRVSAVARARSRSSATSSVFSLMLETRLWSEARKTSTAMAQRVSRRIRFILLSVLSR